MPVAVLVALGLFAIANRNTSSPAPSPTTSRPAPSLPPVTVPPVPRGRAADRFCPDFLAALPQKLEGFSRREVSAGDQYFLAWGEPPIIVRCGVPRPAGLRATSLLQNVDGVDWYEKGPTWTAVGRAVYVSARVPQGVAGQGVLVDVGRVVREKLPTR